MTTTNETRRKVMILAWDLYRSALASTDPRTFADALGGAWRFIKRMAAEPLPRWARGVGKRTVNFAPTYSSPTARAFAGHAHGGVKSYKAAYTTAIVGC